MRDKTIALLSWANLNAFLRACASLRELERLLLHERRGRGRPTFVRRIHSRLNKVRADHERARLLKHPR